MPAGLPAARIPKRRLFGARRRLQHCPGSKAGSHQKLRLRKGEPLSDFQTPKAPLVKIAQPI
jgi:hypothetical protein